MPVLLRFRTDPSMPCPFFARRRRALALAALSACPWLAATSVAMAQPQDDTRRMLEQRDQRQAIERERTLLQEHGEGQRPSIVIDGKS